MARGLRGLGQYYNKFRGEGLQNCYITLYGAGVSNSGILLSYNAEATTLTLGTFRHAVSLTNSSVLNLRCTSFFYFVTLTGVQCS